MSVESDNKAFIRDQLDQDLDPEVLEDLGYTDAPVEGGGTVIDSSFDPLEVPAPPQEPQLRLVPDLPEETESTPEADTSEEPQATVPEKIIELVLTPEAETRLDHDDSFTTYMALRMSGYSDEQIAKYNAQFTE